MRSQSSDGNLNLRTPTIPLYGRVGIYTHEIPIAFYRSSWPIQRREKGVLKRQRLCVVSPGLQTIDFVSLQYTLCMLIKSLRTSPTSPKWHTTSTHNLHLHPTTSSPIPPRMSFS